jgi:hypothetical protein
MAFMVKRVPSAVLFAALAFSASAATVAHAGWLDDVAQSLGGMGKTEILPVAQGGGDEAPGVIPFTTFEAERQQVMEKLPCKWLSMAGGDGVARYDFLCKGGTWASVSLMFDKSARDPSGIGRVRLLYREWPESAHPGGGEAYVAQQFLQHVSDHFIPANVAKEVQEAFWGTRSRTWRVWDSLTIGYTYENEGDFVLHRLEVLGRGKALAVQQAPRAVVTPTEAGLGKAETPPQPTPPQVTAPARDSVFKPLPVFTPKGVSLTVPAAAAPLPPPGTLQNATPADIAKQPEPGSLMKPQPAAPVSDKLVPAPDAALKGRAKAPSNFDVYNKAVEMTRDVEKQAVEEAGKAGKVAVPVINNPMVSATAAATPSVPKPAAKPKGTPPVPDVRTPVAPDQPAPSVNAVPTPQAETEESEPLETPKGPDQWPQGEGLGSPSNAPQVDPALMNPAPRPPDTRFDPARALPQLQYIPKAQPLAHPDEIIQFEDEKSGL